MNRVPRVAPFLWRNGWLRLPMWLLLLSFNLPAGAADSPGAESPSVESSPGDEGWPSFMPPPLSDETAPAEPIPWLDPEGFLPVRNPEGDAVALYAEAARLIRQTPGFPSFPRHTDPQIETPTLREAFRLAYEAASLEKADFLAAHSYRAWEDGGLPDLSAASVIGRGMALSARNFLDSGNSAAAERAAKAVVSMGDHFRRNAPNAAQALVGERILEEGMRALLAVYRNLKDEENARECAGRIASAQGVVAAIQLKAAAEAAIRWEKPAPALAALKDKDPIIRADALLLIEACYHPQGRERLMADPQSAVMVGVMRSDPDGVAAAVQRLSEDSNSIVRRLAERVAPLTRDAPAADQSRR